MANDSDIAQSDLAELLTVLGMGDHARPQSPHEVFQEALCILRNRLATATAEAAQLQAEVEALKGASDMAKAEVAFAQQDEVDGSSHASRRVRFRGILDALNGVGDPKLRTALARAATAGEG